MEKDTLEILMWTAGSAAGIAAFTFSALNLLTYHITNKVVEYFAEDYGVDSAKRFAKEKLEIIKGENILSRKLFLSGVGIAYERFLSRFQSE